MQGSGGADEAGTTLAVASFVCGLELQDLPERAVGGAKKAILDCLGVMLAGSSAAAACLLRDVLAGTEGGSTGALVVGARLRLEPSTAALVNGTAAHALDFDDSSDGMFGHPSACLLPALLALADTGRVAGADLLTGYAAGFELASKLGRHMMPEHYARGWHNTATLGALGAAAAVARALRLDARAASVALGIAASLASGVRLNFGTMTKPLHAGNAARNGLLAGRLAQAGFTADTTVLEGDRGFMDVFGGDRHRGESLVAALGAPLELEEPGVKIKVYPSCTATHRPIDAVLALLRAFAPRAEDIAAVRCSVFPHTPGILIRPMARDGNEAKFSLNYCVARAFLSRGLTLEEFRDERVNEPAVRQLMERVTMQVHPEAAADPGGREFAEVEVELLDGRLLRERVYEQRGHQKGSPLGFEEVAEKFRACATLLEPDAVESLVELVAGMERLPDCGVLGESLSRLRDGSREALAAGSAPGPAGTAGGI